MKPFEALTDQGRIRRLRSLAQAALAAYDLADPQLKFLRQAGNTLFRVAEGQASRTAQPTVYHPGRYLLRVHQPGYQTPRAIELELAWLAGLSQEAGLPVPEPLTNRAGRLITQVELPGVPGLRTCSLLRWVKGRELKREQIRPAHYRGLGELIAGIHNQTARWQPPAGLSKRHYDWDGLFRKVGEDGQPSAEAWALLPAEYVAPFERVAQQARQVMDGWGKGPQVYGLIHGDLGMEANVLWADGTPRLIDFDDSGFGYYLFDLAIVLEDSQDHQIRPELRQALLDGYTRVRPLPAEQLEQLDLFLAAYAVFWSLYGADVVRFYPEHRAEIFERMARYLRLVEHFLNTH